MKIDLFGSSLMAAALLGSSYLSASVSHEVGADSKVCPNAASYGQPSPNTGGVGSIAGEVYSIDGEPLAGVQILIEDAETGFHTGTLSRQDGSFRLGRVPYGFHVVRFQQVGYGSQDHQAMVFGSGTHAVCAVLSALRLPMEN